MTSFDFLYDKDKNIRKDFISLYRGTVKDRNSRISQVRWDGHLMSIFVYWWCELWNLPPIARCFTALQITLVKTNEHKISSKKKKSPTQLVHFLIKITLDSFGNCWLNIWIWFCAHRAHFIHYINHMVNKGIPQSCTLLSITKKLSIECAINM